LTWQFDQRGLLKGAFMGKKKSYEAPPKVVEAPSEPSGFYKGYDIKWLEDQPDHPEHKLVAEFEAKEGE